jgi:DNA polymerase-3 subunit delta'
MALDGLRGHREQFDRLAAELATRPSHGYLFSGPAGVGKALVAEALAHGLLCERAQASGKLESFCCTPDQCPVRTPQSAKESAAKRCDCCAACVQVASGVHPDFNRVSRPKNRTDVLIEQVRELIAQLWIRPSRGPLRVAIIDDAETLNIPAQSALLKTLEEPPGHAIIFLVTSSEHALLDTVRSRLRPARFGPLAVVDIQAIITARAKLDPARAGAIARLSRGSVARALLLIDGDQPPIKELVDGLKGLAKIDFAAATGLAQDHFASREQAAGNFELIARLLEEILCFKLLGAELAAPSPEVAAVMAELGHKLEAGVIATILAEALKAAAAVDAMANPSFRPRIGGWVRRRPRGVNSGTRRRPGQRPFRYAQ